MTSPDHHRPLPVRRVSIPTALRLAQVLADARARTNQAEQTTSAVEHRLEVLTAACHDALLVLDRNGHTVCTNLTADLWGLSGSPTAGAGPWDAFVWVDPRARDRVVAAFQEAVTRRGVPVTVEEVPVLLCTDGSLRPPHARGAGGLVTATFTSLLADPAIEGVGVAVPENRDPPARPEVLQEDHGRSPLDRPTTALLPVPTSRSSGAPPRAGAMSHGPRRPAATDRDECPAPLGTGPALVRAIPAASRAGGLPEAPSSSPGKTVQDRHRRTGASSCASPTPATSGGRPPSTTTSTSRPTWTGTTTGSVTSPASPSVWTTSPSSG